jgi:UDP-glucuronate 4-epimerase
METDKPTLVTGAAGFIGFHLTARLLKDGSSVVGIDNLSDFYDVDIKKARLRQLEANPHFAFLKIDLNDRGEMERLFKGRSFDCVFHMAAQAGVRHSLRNPYAYGESNLSGVLNLLEGCRHAAVRHLIFASSSSVYGANAKAPFSEHDPADHPLSLYAATKKAGELMAHAYAHLYNLPCTILRFFTVYGPWGRPDMALFLFTKAILEEKPIDVFNFGKMRRDFTYVDDIVEAMIRLKNKIPSLDPHWRAEAPDPASSPAPYRIYNIGNNQPVELLRFIEILEEALGKKAIKNLLPFQPGDVPATHANVDDLARAVDFKPKTPLRVGIQKFVDWYRSYYGSK